MMVGLNQWSCNHLRRDARESSRLAAHALRGHHSTRPYENQSSRHPDPRMPGGLPDTPVTASANPQGPPAPTMTPLSSLEFRRYIEPRHPRQRNARDKIGWVEVHFVVDESGRTQKVRVIDAEPTDLFNDAALNAVRKWRFEPFRVDGEPAATESGVRLRFNTE